MAKGYNISYVITDSGAAFTTRKSASESHISKEDKETAGLIAPVAEEENHAQDLPKEAQDLIMPDLYIRDSNLEEIVRLVNKVIKERAPNQKVVLSVGKDTAVSASADKYSLTFLANSRAMK